MHSDWYTLLSMGMRYWFAAIAALIVLRAWRVTVRDTRRARVLRAWAPDTGAIGEIIVLSGGNGVRKGSRIPVPKEGLLGSSRRNDVRLRHKDVKRYHAHIEQRENGVLAETIGKAEIWLSGRTGNKLLLRDGDQFSIGALSLRLVLYSPGEGKEVDLDIAEDEMFSPAGVSAANVKRGIKNEPTEPRREKKIDIFMDDISVDIMSAATKPRKKNETKNSKAATGSKKTAKKSKKVPAADELFMPFDDGFAPYTKVETKSSQAKKTKKKTEEVYWWQEKEQ